MTKLIRNGNYWGIRKRVPQDILRTFDKTRNGKPKEDLWLPISKSHREAKNGIPDAETKARDLFDAHRREMGISAALVALQPVKRTPQQACEAFYAKLQEIERARRTEILHEAKRQLDEYERLITPRKKGDSMFSAAFLGSSVPSTDFFIVSPDRAARQGLHAALSERMTHDIALRLANAKGALAVMDVAHVSEASGETDESLLPLLARTEIAFLEAVLRDPGALFGSMPPLGTVRLGMPASVTLNGTNADDDPLFSEMADEWFKERIGPTGKEWSTERRRIWYATREIFLEVCTDRPISSYRVDDKAELQRVFRSLPSNRNKKLPGKKVREQIVMAAERGLPLMDKVTANEYLHLIEGCFEWIKRSKSVMRGINPFEGSAFQVPKSGKKKVRKFETDELKAVFANPLYATHADTDARYWTPIVGLYTGARSNSILRLKVGDVRTEDGVTFLDINDEEYSDRSIKRTDKTAAGLRRVPVHADLVDLGFMKFVGSRKGHEMLFPGLKPDARGKFADAFGDWFRRHLVRVGVKAGRETNFHSLRHTWDHAAENSRIHEEWRDRLQGHVKQGMRGVYGDNKTEIQLLGDEMAKLRFKGLDLSHLRR